MSDSISGLTARIRDFVAAREWQQYHNPKDMAVAIAAEAGELLQHFVWQQPDQVDRRAKDKHEEIASEIADGPQSVIQEQVEMGVAVRMAVMEALLDPRRNPEGVAA